ncbi:MFS transporter [Candidatus Woesearchaeota archaeon]|nr:MFS transporter [Candidatus Woesearchaeota archaeon]
MTPNYFAKADFLSSLGLVISGILGAFIVEVIGLRSIWLFAAGAYAISFVVLLTAPERYRRRHTSFSRALKTVTQQSGDALRYCRMHHILYAFFIASALWLIAGAIGGVMAWTPFLIELGFAEQHFGYLWSAMAVVQMMGLAISQFALKTISSRKVIIVAQSLFAATLLAVYWVSSLPFALLLVLFSILFASAKAPSLNVFFHRFTPSYMRATIGSVKATLGAAIAILMMPISGHFIDTIGAQNALFSAGLALLPAVGIYLLMKEH